MQTEKEIQSAIAKLNRANWEGAERIVRDLAAKDVLALHECEICSTTLLAAGSWAWLDYPLTSGAEGVLTGRQYLCTECYWATMEVKK